jgi:hypothetical protein
MNKYLLLQVCRKEERLNLAIIVYNRSETRVIVTKKWDRLTLFLDRSVLFFKGFTDRLSTLPPSYQEIEKMRDKWTINDIRCGIEGTSLLPIDALIEELEDRYL